MILHQSIVRTNPLHISPDGVFVRSESIDIPSSQAKLRVSVDITDDRKNKDEDVRLNASVIVLDREDTILGIKSTSFNTNTSLSLDDFVFSLSDVNFWSVQNPYLYSVRVELSNENVILDSVKIDNVGIRDVTFDANKGLFINDQHIKLRGFCDHSNFGGVGAAVPDRVNLFRAQMLRSIGANSWRMAHNPPIPIRLGVRKTFFFTQSTSHTTHPHNTTHQIMDRLGMLALDENRDFGGPNRSRWSHR